VIQREVARLQSTHIGAGDLTPGACLTMAWTATVAILATRVVESKLTNMRRYSIAVRMVDHCK
jgi:hypothetical protein